MKLVIFGKFEDGSPSTSEGDGYSPRLNVKIRVSCLVRVPAICHA